MAWARIKKTHCFEHLFADILSLLPVHNAARTTRNSKFVLKEIVEVILLQHIGDIVIDSTTSDNVEEVLEYLNSPVCLNQPLHSFKDVAMHAFEGSKVNVFDLEEGRDIATELMDFPRASPKAELFCTPCTD
ncbi:hypothetical protein KY290_020296 [Solanum tuberosum]|uniref:Uncharacterized protein n=1 Tax=Solanum tuberosum TaxID=4113 RepID=A0ABQ7V080_SOLTU|nr:hypothetical protein KY290_020296 [Solanum tuberosum]